MEERQEQIHKKGFDIFGSEFSNQQILSAPPHLDYGKIKVGVKNLDDAVMDLGSYRKLFPNFPFGDKQAILMAIYNRDYPVLREISNFYYNISGIYQRSCNYFAFLYRYDWYVVPEIVSSAVGTEKLLKDFHKVLRFLDKSNIKKNLGDIALQVIVNGCYYGYKVPSSSGVILQDLPVNYCRSRYKKNGRPVVEFNMSYFDRYRDTKYREKVLNLFPPEFKKGYRLYQKRKLQEDDIYMSSIGYIPRGARREMLTTGWYLLEPENCVKFNFNNNDMPLFINSIPAIIDLDLAQDLDRRKQMQKLLKILVQKLPMDKNNDLIFDIDEAKDIHNNAVEMLRRAVGVDVLTTFADIDSIDMSDSNTVTSKDDLEKVERTVFNSLGISQNLFNTDGNLSLEKSILNDASSVRNLLLQFEMFFKEITENLLSTKKYTFKFHMLETTQDNYQALSKLYKEQTSIGYSKMLPQIALGHSQSSILNSITFENDYLDLISKMIPPMSSNTMSSTVLDNNGKSANDKNDKNQTSKNQSTQTTIKENKEVGRPEKEDSEKSDKTLKNKESMA